MFIKFDNLNFSKFFLFILLLILVLFLGFQSSWSKGRFDLGADNYLTYELGNLDENFLNGNITDIQLFDQTGLIAKADNLIIKSRNISQNEEKYIIDFLSLKGFSASENGNHFFLGELIITDFPHFNYFDKFITYEQSRQNFSLKINDVRIKSEFGDAQVSNVRVPKIKQEFLSSGTPFTSEMSFEVNDFSFLPNPMNMDMVPSIMVLTALGQEKFSFNLKTKGNSEDKGIFLDSYSTFKISMKGGVDIFFDIGFLVPIQLIEKYSNSLNNFDFQQYYSDSNQFDQELLQEFAGIQISKINFTVTDRGLMKPLLIMYSSSMGQSQDEAINSLTGIIFSSLQQFLPLNAEKLIIPISNFLNVGGSLNFNVSPPNPVAIMASLAFFVMPDLAIESLGISLTHKQ